jgi:hypothetical protein
MIPELRHVNIVRLHDVIHTETKLVLIFEVSYGPLAHPEKPETKADDALVLRDGPEEVHGSARG